MSENKIIDETKLIKRLKFRELPFDEEEVYQKLKQRINNQLVTPSPKIIYQKWISVAAVLVIALLVSFWLFNKPSKDSLFDFVASTQTPNYMSSDIQLIISKDSIIPVDGKSSDIQYNTAGQVNINSQLSVNAKTRDDVEEEVYNQLIVPAGKTSSITFSDGTKIYMNSKSRIVYPVTFSNGKREIYLEGEAYLEVFHNEQQPFIVKTDQMQIRVLGTCFNVCAYKQDPSQSVVLVKGKVEVKTDKATPKTIHPNEMVSCENNQLRVELVDASQYITWRDGYYQYNREKLTNILKRLSRHYGREFECGKDLEQLTCTGKLDLKNDIYSVLQTLKKATPIEIVENLGKIHIFVKPLKKNPNEKKE